MADTSATTTKQANRYQVSGDGIKVTYSTSSFAGPPLFSYDDGKIKKEFSGKEITVVSDTALGTLVSVLIIPSVDRDRTTFTLLVPRTNLGSGDSVDITTLGIRCEHRIRVPLPPPPQGDVYTSHVLTGKAESVVF